jgi:hypothetical protein
MSNWDGIPAELHPVQADFGILTAILWNVIEARAIYRDFFYARSLKIGERRLPRKWESNYVRAGGSIVAPSKDWNAQIAKLAANSKILARGIRSPGLNDFLLKVHTMSMTKQKIDRLFFTYIEQGADVVPVLQRPQPLDSWFVPGRPDRLIRYLRMEYPR